MGCNISNYKALQRQYDQLELESSKTIKDQSKGIASLKAVNKQLKTTNNKLLEELKDKELIRQLMAENKELHDYVKLIRPTTEK